MTALAEVSRAIQDAIPGWLADDGTVEDVDLARAALTALHDSFADPVVRAAIQAALDEKEA